MDIKQLAYFVAIANEKQITRAAQKLYITQPYLSRQLKEMEDELGVRLVDRSGSYTMLTDHGRALLEKAQDILARVDDLKTLVSLDATQCTGTLRIGVLISCAGHVFPHLKTMHTLYPQLTFQIQEMPPFRILELLKKREIELAFIRKTELPLDDFNFFPLGTEEYCLCVAREQDPYPDSDSVTLQQVAHLPLVMPNNGWTVGHNERIRKEYARIGQPMNIICQCSNSSLIITLVCSGIGASILSTSFAVNYPSDRLNYKRLINFAESSTPIVVWNKNSYLSFFAQTLLEDMGVKL